MSRAERLLDLLQVLRRHRMPVSGQKLADELGVSLRTVYRDIATLVGQGASIEGEAGIGYVLRPGFLLPPLMFAESEIEALVLGARLLARRADEPLARAAESALARIAAVLPPDLRDAMDASGLLAGPVAPLAAGSVDLAGIRRAIRAEVKVQLAYRDAAGRASERTVWPVALGFFEEAHVLVAWCELRQGFRHFRADRIADFSPTETRYPRRRRALMKEWREAERVPAQ